jgi:excisionase family DNA binding protein
LVKLLYSVDETCQVLSIKRSKLYELLAAGEIASVKIGKSRRISEAALRDYVAQLGSQAPLDASSHVAAPR